MGIVGVNGGNVAEEGFFGYKSKPKRWLSAYDLSIVDYNGKLLSYHPIGKKDVLKWLAK